MAARTSRPTIPPLAFALALTLPYAGLSPYFGPGPGIDLSVFFVRAVTLAIAVARSPKGRRLAAAGGMAATWLTLCLPMVRDVPTWLRWKLSEEAFTRIVERPAPASGWHGAFAVQELARDQPPDSRWFYLDGGHAGIICWGGAVWSPTARPTAAIRELGDDWYLWQECT